MRSQKLRHRCRVIAGSNERIQTGLIGKELALLAVLGFESAGLSIEVLDQLVVFIENVAAIADRSYTENFFKLRVVSMAPR